MTVGSRPFSAPRAALISMTLAITGALVGSGLAQIVASRVFVLARAPLALRLPQVAAYAPPAVDGGLFRAEAPQGSDPTTAPSTSCDPAWRLVGAAFFPDAPERSLVAVHTPSGGAVLTASDQRDAWTLVAAGRDRATLRDADGRECEIAMGSGRGVDRAESEAPRESSELIEALGERHYRVERAAIEQASMQPPLRLVPRADGVRVFGVRRSSLAAQAGIENGDVVTAIDGQPPTSASGLDAYARAMGGEPVRITVERRGQPIELRYELSP